MYESEGLYSCACAQYPSVRDLKIEQLAVRALEIKLLAALERNVLPALEVLRVG